MSLHALLTVFLPLLAVTLGSASQKPQCFKAIPKNERPGTLLFHFGGNFPPFDVLADSPKPDTQTGFGVEFAQRLCKMYDLNCQVVRQAYEECWTKNSYPGPGVYDGSYDTCSTYTHTYLRQTGLDFSFAIVKSRPAGILTRLEKGRPVISPSSHDLQGRRIAQIPGWSTDAASLVYTKNGCTGKRFTNYTLVFPKDSSTGPDSAFRALLNGEVDGVYTRSSIVDDRKGCTVQDCDAELYAHLGTKYAWIHTGLNDNYVNGTTLSMTKKGSKLNAFLNPLIQCFMESEGYAKLCEAYDGEDIVCFQNSYMSTSPEIRVGHLPNKARTQLCQSENEDEYCDSCQSGFCGCAA